LILCALTIIALASAQAIFAQTTVIAYQGKLDIDGVPATGNYDFQFQLFDEVSDGNQQGPSQERLNVTVTNGTYTVNLDFGSAVFLSNAPRFLEVSFRTTGSSAYTALTPLQVVTTTPYSIHSMVANTAHILDATCVGCVTSSQIQNVQGFQVTGSVAGGQIIGTIPVTSVPAGSGNYIRNTLSQQSGSNFNIDGSAIVGGLLSGNTVNATTQYSLGTSRVLGYDASNLFVGFNAGNTNTTGTFNLSVGSSAGNANTTGSENNFFGFQAGRSNTTGAHNSFFGGSAGNKNTAGNFNSFFGYNTGYNNTGSENSFFGSAAGYNNTTGVYNSFFGRSAGTGNTTGLENSFFGWGAGFVNTTGQSNSFFGFGAGAQNSAGSGNTFIGSGANFSGASTTESNNTLLGYNSRVDSGVSNSTAIGAGAQAIASNTVVLGTKLETVIVRGKLQVDLLAAAGSQQLCLNNSSRLAPCSSSLRYKTDLRPFAEGMSIINRLQPISFSWKDGGLRDLGFGAEDVQKIEPLLVTYNPQGIVEGVKYDRITAVLVNALKEQQKQIEELKVIKAENAELKAQLAAILVRLERVKGKKSPTK
jgi:hypothetical protein